MLAALASVVRGLFNDTGAGQDDELTLRLAGPRDNAWIEVTTRRVAHSSDRSQLPLSLAAAPLTEAERTVLRYLPTHLNYPQIAKELHVSRHTVKSQIVSIYRKLGVTSRTAAVESARELRLLPTASSVPVAVDMLPSGSEVTARPTLEFDREDMFGFRRAWVLLPERERDGFLDRWTEIGESCGYHVLSISAQAAAEGERWSKTDSVVALAWWTISDAMTAYLEWRDA